MAGDGAGAVAVGLVLLLLLAAPVLGQEETAAAEEVVSEPDWGLALGVAASSAHGNSEAGAGGLTLELDRDWQRWSLVAYAKGRRHTNDSVTTAESYDLRLTGRRRLTERWNLYARQQAYRNRFAGIDLRTTFTVGAHREIAPRSRRWTGDLSLGLGLEREAFASGEADDQYGHAQAELDGTLALSRVANLRHALTLHQDLSNEDNLRVDLDLRLRASVNRWLALEIGYDVKFDREPVPGKKSTDRLVDAALVFTLGRASRDAVTEKKILGGG